MKLALCQFSSQTQMNTLLRPTLAALVIFQMPAYNKWHLKDNLIQTQALGGVKYVLTDGTDEIGYEIGGIQEPPTIRPVL